MSDSFKNPWQGQPSGYKQMLYFVKTSHFSFICIHVHQVEPNVLLGLSAVGDATVMPVFVYTIFGSSHQLAVGPVALISLLVANVLSGIVDSSDELYTELAILLALMENDETVEQAAMREVLEEAGVRGDLMASLGEYDFKSKTLHGKLCPQGLCKGIVKLVIEIYFNTTFLVLM
ncbi:hypothetical protein V2J09_016417 [Rumex salicifolius]